MIRNIGEKIFVSKYIEVEEIIIRQKIVSIVINPEAKTMEVSTSLLNNKGESVADRSTIIDGDDYDFLFSDNEYFGVGKEAGTYREADLWKMIDKLS